MRYEVDGGRSVAYNLSSAGLAQLLERFLAMEDITAKMILQVDDFRQFFIFCKGSEAIIANMSIFVNTYFAYVVALR